jgi:signal transduction histidine kinase
MNSNHIIKRNLPNHNLILAPLVSFKGAHGFVLFRNNTTYNIEDNTEYLLENFTGYLASCINSRFLDLENESIRNQIDQVVAVQTKSLMDKKKEINEKIEELKSSLLMTMPHEVRTPLNQILGLTDYLIKSVNDVDEEELTEVLNDIYESAVRLRRLFENYLYLSTLNITAYDIEKLNQLKNSILPSAESVIYESAMNLAYKYEKQESIELNLVDSELNITEEHLSKLLFEIIDNAFKFGDENTKVNISSELSNDNYIIKILDNGIGIPIERIYMLDAYIQFDRLSNEQQGSGLGLAIAKRIAIIYDGDIQFKSKPNEFTEVTITLPVASN